MNGKETFMVETLTRELITRLMEERSLAMREAMDIVYNSRPTLPSTIWILASISKVLRMFMMFWRRK